MIRSETIGSYLDRLASGRPTPGGGATGALQAAQAAALLAMSARFSGDDEPADDGGAGDGVAARAERLVRTALALADADESGFASVAEAYRLPGDGDAAAERSRAIQDAVRRAAEPPRAILTVAEEVLALAEALLPECNPNVLSDLAASSESARAAAVAAVVTLEINIASLKDDAAREPLLEDVARGEALVERSGRLTASVRAALADRT